MSEVTVENPTSLEYLNISTQNMTDVSPSVSIYRWAVAALAVVVFKFVVDNVLSVRAAFSRIKDYPGRLALWINPLNAISIALGTTFPRPGMGGNWAEKFALYKKFGVTGLASVTLSTAQQVFWLADSEAIRIVSSGRNAFQKDVGAYEVINIYGGNLVSSEGSHWKRHRSIAMSAFNEANVALAWSEALRVIDEWFTQLDTLGSDIAVDLLSPMTQATLLVITAAGFGRRISWTADSTAELLPGCKLTFESAVINSVNNIVFRALTPGWFYRFSSLVKVPYLSSRALLAQLAFEDLRTHMLDIVASARAEITASKRSGASGAALLRNLVEANMIQNQDSKKLSEEELLSDIFTFLLAGHETSAHSLCFIFGLLALYPGCQQKVYEEVTRVWPADVPLTQLMTNHKEYMDKFEYTTACIRETLRMYPAEPRISKVVHADAILPGTYFTSESKDSPPVETGKFSMAVPVGSAIILDIWAVHMNPLYWGEDVAEFKPERFIDTESYQWPRNAYMPFSIGARSCIGQRFAYAEMIGIIASVVRQYRILVPDDLARKPFEQQREVLLKWTTGITLTPVKTRVRLCRRVS